MIWQSPGLPGWRKVNFITVTRRPHYLNIAAGLCCLATSPGFLPTLCEKWSGFFYVHRVFLSYTRDRRLKVSSERLGNEDKAPCPRALLPGQGSNRGPPVWKSEALTARPRQLLMNLIKCKFHSLNFYLHLELNQILFLCSLPKWPDLSGLRQATVVLACTWLETVSQISSTELAEVMAGKIYIKPKVSGLWPWTLTFHLHCFVFSCQSFPPNLITTEHSSSTLGLKIKFLATFQELLTFDLG